ncbi:MAG: AmmeMemoRadiSam system protein A [Gammaproteobacteria bacterium]|nr:AmmeMemoRadiSam system protein A [Gammaproteobacteria bacterium]
MLEIALAAIDHEFGRLEEDAAVDLAREPPEIRECKASFVTIRKEGRLRGCIGSLTAHRPLAVDVAANACAAAFRDPRFQPLTERERPAIELSIATLSSLTPISFTSADELHAVLFPGRDGIVLSHHQATATFLPDVWQALPEPHEFIRELRRKAGIAESVPPNRIRVSRYTTQSFGTFSLDPQTGTD